MSDMQSADTPVNRERVAGDEIYQRIGQLTRTLHDALRELGYDKGLNSARANLPDARDRLSYISRLTGEAAEKVLNAVDQARKEQDDLDSRTAGLRRRWQALVEQRKDEDRAAHTRADNDLIAETCDFLSTISGHAERTNQILTNIMMAQDFHDLTGQVISRVVALACNLEEQLLKLLIDATPAEQHKKADGAAGSPGLEGPVVKPEGRSDVVTDQAGVDDLLASLGF